jgi:glyoxylase-like metal-dependent hydrolase (beta-lactamase superfamily II)
MTSVVLSSSEIAPGLHRFASPLVSFYALEQGGRLTLVDAGLPKHADALAAALAGLGKTKGDIEAVVLTHSDADHTGVAGRLQAIGARVLIHSDDDATLRKPGPKSGDASPRHLVELMWRPRFWRFFGGMARAGGAHPTKVEGAELFSDGDRLDVPGRPLVVHTPGHTAGHCAFLVEDAGALFAGDELCTTNPVTGEDRPQLMPRQTNVSNADCVASLARLEGLQAGVILPGHGEPWHGSPARAVERARETAKA